MVTSGELIAQNLARGGGLEAQLQMGRDRLERDRMAQDYGLQQQQFNQAIQLQAMRDALARDQMSQQDRQFGMGQDLNREQMAMQQARWQEEQAIRQAAADMKAMEWEQQQEELAMEQEAGGAYVEAMVADEIANSDFGRSVIDWYKGDPERRGKQARMLLEGEHKKKLDLMKASGVGKLGQDERVISKVSELMKRKRLADQGMAEPLSPEEEWELQTAMETAETNARGGKDPLAQKFLERDRYGNIVSMEGYDQALAGREQKIEYAGKWGELQADRDNIPLAEEAKRIAVATSDYKNFEAGLPSLFNTVNKLRTLAEVANYSSTQKISDRVRRELQSIGFGEVSDGASARAAYDNYVKSNVLPNLKAMLGAQFTAVEGQWVLDTFGGTGTPQEKMAALDARVISYLNDMRTKAIRAGIDPWDNKMFSDYLHSVGEAEAFGAPKASGGDIDYNSMYGLE